MRSVTNSFTWTYSHDMPWPSHHWPWRTWARDAWGRNPSKLWNKPWNCDVYVWRLPRLRTSAKQGRRELLEFWIEEWYQSPISEHRWNQLRKMLTIRRFQADELLSSCWSRASPGVMNIDESNWSRVVRHRDHRVTVLHHKIGIEWERNANWLFHLQALSGIGIIWYQWFQMIPSYPMKRGMMWHAISGCRQAGWWISEMTSDYDRTDITSRTSSSWESTHCRRKRKKRVQLYSASWHTHDTLMEPWNTHALIATYSNTARVGRQSLWLLLKSQQKEWLTMSHLKKDEKKACPKQCSL